MNKHEEFVTVWQQASSAIEVADKLGMSAGLASSKAAYLRRLGVPLKKFRSGARVDPEALKKLCVSLEDTT